MLRERRRKGRRFAPLPSAPAIFPWSFRTWRLSSPFRALVLHLFADEGEEVRADLLVERAAGGRTSWRAAS